MRKILIALLPLLLAGCVDDTASYRTDGGNLSITVHRAQEHIWSNDVTVEVVVARQPECQRRVELGVIPADDVEFELLSPGDDQWYLRAGQQLWQFETVNCTQYEEAKGQPGQLLGTYKVEAASCCSSRPSRLRPRRPHRRPRLSSRSSKLRQ